MYRRGRASRSVGRGSTASNVPLWVWLMTFGVFLVLLLADLVVTSRKPHEHTAGEGARAFGSYLLVTTAFGAVLWLSGGSAQGLEFIEEFVTESILALELIVVVSMIFAQYALPRIWEQRVLVLAIAVAVVLRAGIVLAGSSLILTFSWLLYASGAFYVLKAVRTTGNEHDEPGKPRRLPRLFHRLAPVPADYHAGRIAVKINGRRAVTPVFLVIVAVGTADLLVAPNSTHPYIVITANFFALFATRALFAIGGRSRTFVDLIRPGTGMMIVFVLIATKFLLQALAASGVRHVGTVSLPTITPAPMAIAVAGVMAFTLIWRIVKLARRAGTTPA
jgi:tellurite resistance protein TerC